MGSDGRLVIDNAGDGRDESGAWTGTYKASASLWRQDQSGTGASDNAGTGLPETIVPSEEYIARITPPQGGELASGVDANGARKISVATGGNSSGAPMIGISAGEPAFLLRSSSPKFLLILVIDPGH